MHNFLSADIENFRLQVWTQYSEACSHCVEKANFAATGFKNLVFNDHPPSERIAVVMWSKCVRACQAAFLLAERGMIPDAQGTLRGAVETLFHAIALVRKPEVLAKMFAHDDIEKGKQVRRMLAHTEISSVLSSDDRQRLESIVKEKKGSAFSVYDAAMASELGHLYETIYRTLSQHAAHSTLSSLNHELEDGGKILVMGPTTAEIEWTIKLITECLDAGIYVMNPILKN